MEFLTPFITEDCLKNRKKSKRKKSEEFIWGEPDSMDDYSIEEILDMPIKSSIYEELEIENKDDFY